MVTGDKKKIALVFSGAVSLGSYEAGVAYEIVNYIQKHNNPEFDVDVIVGSSAGALTGALMAIALVYGLDPAMIEEAWLSVKLEDLLRLEKGDKSILSSSRIEKLIARYISKPPNYMLKHTGKVINLAVVVTNLDGIQYQIHRSRDGEFAVNAIGYEDAMRFMITSEFEDWDRLRRAVRASSAFPAAFEHKTITRSHRELRKHTKYRFPTEEPIAFHYSDGGIVNNQPLNQAIEVVNELSLPDYDKGSERIFLVVDPSPPRAEGLGKDDYRVFDVVSKAVWTIPRNQTLYKDLLHLEKVNRRLRWKNSFVSAMADIWDAGRISAEHAQALDRLCRDVALFKGQAMLGLKPAEYLRAEEERIRNAYHSEIQKLRSPDPFVKYCFLLEQVADLRNKHEILVEMISPLNPGEELAGVIFGNFGGFLDSGFMKHDFNVGQDYAKRWLKREVSLDRLLQLGQQGIPNNTKRKVFQGLLDNSLPILIEDIGPRLFTGKGDLPADLLGVLAFVKMCVVSLTKYIVRKSIAWTKEKIFP